MLCGSPESARLGRQLKRVTSLGITTTGMAGGKSARGQNHQCLDVELSINSICVGCRVLHRLFVLLRVCFKLLILLLQHPAWVYLQKTACRYKIVSTVLT